jgi:hypothetical protein
MPRSTDQRLRLVEELCGFRNPAASGGNPSICSYHGRPEGLCALLVPPSSQHQECTSWRPVRHPSLKQINCPQGHIKLGTGCAPLRLTQFRSSRLCLMALRGVQCSSFETVVSSAACLPPRATVSIIGLGHIAGRQFGLGSGSAAQPGPPLPCPPRMALWLSAESPSATRALYGAEV